jgi:hypothetical protein
VAEETLEKAISESGKPWKRTSVRVRKPWRRSPVRSGNLEEEHQCEQKTLGRKPWTGNPGEEHQ